MAGAVVLHVIAERRYWRRHLPVGKSHHRGERYAARYSKRKTDNFPDGVVEGFVGIIIFGHVISPYED
jgi:hypothetical protein